MAAHSERNIPQQPSSLDIDLDSLLQTSPPLTFDEGHPSQLSTIRSFGRVTPQTTRLLAEDPQPQPTFNGDPIQTLAKGPVASAEAQDFFVYSTSILKASFLKTRNPSDTEISRLAVRTGLDEYRVSTWFDMIKGLPGDNGLKTLPTPEMTQAYVPPYSNLGDVSEFPPPVSIDPGLSATVKYFPTRSPQTKSTRRQRRLPIVESRPGKRKRKEKALQNNNLSLAMDDHRDPPQRHSDKALTQGQFCCPTCKFKTTKMDQWYTHQSRKHFPSEIFVCRINSGGEPCNKGLDHPCKRKDNFATHLKESHGYESGLALDEEVSKCTVKVTGLFHDKCGFCSKTLDNREDSTVHIGRHIEDGDAIDDWIHQCTSLDHKLEHHVHFDIFPDEAEIDDADSDDDDTDQGGFGSWTQGGDFDPSQHGDSFGWDPDQGPGERNPYGGIGGTNPPMGFTTAAQGVVSHRAETLKQVTLLECLEQDSYHARPLQSFTVQRSLGHGSSGAVFEVSQGDLKQSFALKTIRRKSSGSSDAPQYDAFKNEVRIMKSLRHPHIVQLLDYYIEPGRFLLLLHPVADMDLARYLRTAEKLPLEGPSFLERSRVLLGATSSLAAALKVIHSSSVTDDHRLGIAHCDIKPANILISNNRVYIADFGAAKTMPHNGIPTMKDILVTPDYAAPETIKSRSLSPASDIFSLGCVFLEMMTFCMARRSSDFADFRATALGEKSFHKTLGKTYEWIDMLKEQERYDLVHSIPFDTIRNMLRENPDNRPTALEVWRQLPKCTCCSDCQATNHQLPSNQGDVGDQVPHIKNETSPSPSASSKVSSLGQSCRSTLYNSSDKIPLSIQSSTYPLLDALGNV